MHILDFSIEVQTCTQPQHASAAAVGDLWASGAPHMVWKVFGLRYMPGTGTVELLRVDVAVLPVVGS
jgi:hypothetical protein